MTPRYRVTWTQYGAWYVEDRVSGLTTYAGDTWADAMRHVAARYDRLRRAQDYMHHFHPDQIDADESYLRTRRLGKRMTPFPQL